MSRPAGTVEFVLAFRPHSDLLAGLSTVSAGRYSRLCSSISASFRFTRQNVHCIGQADLLDGRFTRPASKPAGEQTDQNIGIKQDLKKLKKKHIPQLIWLLTTVRIASSTLNSFSFSVW